jgi:hypothetical protein
MAPDPILPDLDLWPTIGWLAFVITAVVGSVVHAALRGRWLWVCALVIGPPLAVPLYWLFRAPDPVDQHA